jgi:ABC-2 type transport system ATP-binding protein
MLDIRGLRFRYGAREALRGVDFSVAPGELFGVLGPNGSGKSTLFQILATLLPLIEGTVLIGGHSLAAAPRAARRCLGVVFQSSSLDLRLTVEENLLLQAALYGLRGGERRRRAEEALDRFALRERRQDLARTLSGGMRRRVEIAKALLHRPQLLLLDEASTGLDPRARRELLELLERLRREEGLTTLFTTHLLDEADAASRVLLLHEGRAVLLGEPERLKAEVGGDVVVFQGVSQENAARLRERFPGNWMERDGQWRVEVPEGPRFLAQAFEAFPGLAESAGIHKPTLEDVYLRATGEAWDV